MGHALWTWRVSVHPGVFQSLKSARVESGPLQRISGSGADLGALDPHSHAFELKIFFLTCVVVAGLYGGLTATRKILFVQALPAAAALIAVHIH